MPCLIYISLQKVSAEIVSQVKGISSPYEQSVKLGLIEKYLVHSLNQFSNPCKDDFILSQQLRMGCSLGAVASI